LMPMMAVCRDGILEWLVGYGIRTPQKLESHNA
jgi:hypothetical protein